MSALLNGRSHANALPATNQVRLRWRSASVTSGNSKAIRAASSIVAIGRNGSRLPVTDRRYRRASIGEGSFGAMTDRSYAACATRRRIMQTRAINPTPWLQGFNINHGVEVTGVQRTLYLSGQTANAADGTP